MFGDVTQFVCEPERRGHGHCRTVGAQIATGEWLLLTDAHMRFVPGWFDRFQHSAKLVEWNTILTGPYLSCTGNDVLLDTIWGARFYFWEQQGEAIDVISAQPSPFKFNVEDGALQTVPALIGANYFITREWFHKIGGLQGLVGWSVDEWLLSVKTWLCGGSILLDPKLHLRHLFYHGQGRSTMSKAELIYNKLSMAFQTLDDSGWTSFQENFPVPLTVPEMARAWQIFRERFDELRILRDFTHAQFERDVDWLCSRFELNHPADIGAVMAA